MLKQMRPSMNPLDDPFQSAYKCNRSALDAVASIIHHTCHSLDAPIKSIRCAFLDYSSVFDSVSWSVLLLELETFDYPTHF